MTPRMVRAVASNVGLEWHNGARGGHNCLLPNGYVRTTAFGLLIQIWHLLLKDSVIAVQRVYLRCGCVSEGRRCRAASCLHADGHTTVGRGVTPVRKMLPLN